MSVYDEFSTDFRALLQKIPPETPLPEWQFLYRQVIFAMGMTILERFTTAAVGHNPFPAESVGPRESRSPPGPTPPPSPTPPPGKGPSTDRGGGGRGAGGQPNIAELVAFVVSI
jgi:hypothetical protein